LFFRSGERRGERGKGRERECVCVNGRSGRDRLRWACVAPTAQLGLVMALSLRQRARKTKRGERVVYFFLCGSWPGSQGYIQDKYTMHKAELGQEQNKRTYKDGKDNMTVTCVHCPVASPGVSGMSGEEGMCSLQGYSTCSPYNGDGGGSG